jgi:hypothetical protein
MRFFGCSSVLGYARAIRGVWDVGFVIRREVAN